MPLFLLNVRMSVRVTDSVLIGNKNSLTPEPTTTTHPDDQFLCLMATCFKTCVRLRMNFLNQLRFPLYNTNTITKQKQ